MLRPSPLRLALSCLAMMALAAPGASRGEDGADLILRHGRFYTVAAKGPAVIEGSLVVRQGRIAFLGDDAGAMRQRARGTRVLDLEGRAVTPGWIDAHSHLLGLGQALGVVDLRSTASYEELIERVRTAASKVPEGTWIFGRGWDQNPWPGSAFPEHGPLSAAVPRHPVWLNRVDGHAALINRRAIEHFGLNDSQADPVGGKFLRDAAGRLSGVLVDTAQNVVASRLLEPSAEQALGWLRSASAHALERGLTTVTEMGTSATDLALYQQAATSGVLGLRVAAFLGDDEDLLAEWFARGPLRDPSGRLTVRGVKLYTDGALGSRGAALVEPYSDDPGNLGLLITASERVFDVTSRAHAAGFQIGVHAIGDRGNLVALDGIERALHGRAAGLPSPRARIEHAQVMRIQDIERMARLGVIASVQPTHATSDMPWAERRVGPVRIEGSYAWRRMLEAGVRLALGSDFPVEAADPLLGFYAAITRQSVAGTPAGGWRAEERLTREEALRGFTLDAAWSLFLEDEVGSLEVGKRADLVVFERDPMRAPEAEIPKIRVDLTVLDGVPVFERSPRAGASR